MCHKEIDTELLKKHLIELIQKTRPKKYIAYYGFYYHDYEEEDGYRYPPLRKHWPFEELFD
jgi:hypothetical protein